jgi:hypothetical protein
MNSWYPGTGMGRDCNARVAGQARGGQKGNRLSVIRGGGEPVANRATKAGFW